MTKNEVLSRINLGDSRRHANLIVLSFHETLVTIIIKPAVLGVSTKARGKVFLSLASLYYI